MTPAERSGRRGSFPVSMGSQSTTETRTDNHHA
jgi:hypothetical protein